MTDTTKIDERAESLILTMVDKGIFSIDQDGRVWRHAARARGLRHLLSVPRRAEYESTNGYLRMRVSVHGVRIRVSAHRLVYRYFFGEIPAGCVVNHINRNRQDNRPSNLEAVTQSANTRHALGLPYCGALESS